MGESPVSGKTRAHVDPTWTVKYCLDSLWKALRWVGLHLASGDDYRAAPG